MTKVLLVLVSVLLGASLLLNAGLWFDRLDRKPIVIAVERIVVNPGEKPRAKQYILTPGVIDVPWGEG